MKKFIWISLVLLFVLGCGSRKRNVQSGSEKTQSENSTSINSSSSINQTTKSETNLSQFLENKNLKITSNGSPYQFQYGNLIFSGTADVDFSEKKEQKIVKHIYISHIFYKTQTNYNTETTYKTENKFKTVDVQRSGISFGTIVWIVIASMIFGVIAWILLKSYLPKWRFNLFNRE